MGFDGLYRMLIIGRDEDRRGHGVNADFIDDPEPVQVWHPDIQEYQIRGELANLLHGFKAISRHPHDFDVRLSAQTQRQAGTSWFLVVDYEGLNHLHTLPPPVA